ncbi:MAG TPA: PilZ domain-containing protein [Polyangiales bacterium]|jgi:hypothetical protein|nr:PilZ domain-containing protein [Polyangiales bacterium]
MENAVQTSSSTRRKSLRRAVRLEADVLADLWDGPVPFVATNLSPDGLFLESDLPLEIGSELIVSFVPPRWQTSEPVTALAEVARVGLFRRRRERRMSGMGLRFLELENCESDLLAEALRGLPPPLPKRSDRHTTIELVRPSLDEGAFPQVVLADGSRFTFRAEGALLTAGRGPEPMLPRNYAPVVPLSSTMSAILRRTHAEVIPLRRAG